MSDVTINVHNAITHSVPNNPLFLIKLRNGKFVLCLSKPATSNFFAEVKGVFVDKSVISGDEVAFFKQNARRILEQTPMESRLEIYIPSNRISYILNISFNANKVKQ